MTKENPFQNTLIEHYHFEQDEQSHVTVNVIINKDNPPSVDGVQDFVNEIAEELYEKMITQIENL